MCYRIILINLKKLDHFIKPFQQIFQTLFPEHNSPKMTFFLTILSLFLKILPKLFLFAIKPALQLTHPLFHTLVNIHLRKFSFYFWWNLSFHQPKTKKNILYTQINFSLLRSDKTVHKTLPLFHTRYIY
jgi:hypothetical protein